MSAHTLDWLPNLEKALAQLDEIPLFGHPPPLNLKQIAEELATFYHWPELEIQIGAMQWTEKDALMTQLSSDVYKTSVRLDPLQGTATVFIEMTELDKICKWILKSPAALTLEKSYKEGLLDFFTLSAMGSIENSGAMTNLAMRQEENSDVVQEASLASVLNLKMGEEIAHVHLIISKTLQHSWKEHFEKTPSPPTLKDLNRLDLFISFKVGQVDLSNNDYQKLQAGDFIVLDQCGIDPTKKKGHVFLTLQQAPLFRGRWKNNEVEIQDAPVYFENSQDPEKNSVNDEEIEEKDPQPSEESPGEPFEPKEAMKALEQYKVTMVVEMGRVKMSAEQLLSLKPGNVLELSPSNGANVSLVVNGSIVGKGDLMRVGEVVGIRVTQIV